MLQHAVTCGQLWPSSAFPTLATMRMLLVDAGGRHPVNAKVSLAERPPTWLEMESVKSLAEAGEITSLTPDTLRRNFGDLVIKLSPNRDGMRLRDILTIAN